MPRRRLSPDRPDPGRVSERRPKTDRAAAPSGPSPARAAPRPKRERPQDVPDGLVCLGAFAGARGVQGEVRIKPFTQDPLGVGAYGPVRDRTGRTFALQQVRSHKDGLIARVDGVTSRDAADALKGTAFYVERAVLPATDDEDSFYHTDLIGLDALGSDGERLGSVKAVHDFGAGDLLELRLEETGRLVLVPFTREIVPVVDVAGGRVVISPTPGLLDEGPDLAGETPGVLDGANMEEEGGS